MLVRLWEGGREVVVEVAQSHRGYLAYLRLRVLVRVEVVQNYRLLWERGLTVLVADKNCLLHQNNADHYNEVNLQKASLSLWVYHLCLQDGMKHRLLHHRLGVSAEIAEYQQHYWNMLIHLLCGRMR